MNFLVLVAALVVATPALIMAYNVLEIRRWTRVPGVVLSTDLVPMTHRGSAGTSYRPVVRYSYRVNDTEHRGNVFTHGMQSGGSKRWAQRIIDRYPPGTSITVLHHPTQPTQACLTAVFGFFGWVLALLALLLMLLAVAV